MPSVYDAIYLSPHLDDVALSCGGQIFGATRTGQRVLIVTITAGDPPPPLFPAMPRVCMIAGNC
ncbi:MAG: PIG-L family deacetylase [Caldilineaceae bacterium]